MLNSCRELEREGVEVTYVRVGSDGVVDPAEIRRALRPETVLISVMHANNELGTIQPIEEISRHRARGGGLAARRWRPSGRKDSRGREGARRGPLLRSAATSFMRPRESARCT